MAFMKARGFGPFSQFYELLHIILGSVDSFKGISGSHQNSWIWSFLVVFMCYCILFWGPSTDSSAYLAVMKTRGFGHFSQFYGLLRTILGSVEGFEGNSSIY